MDDLTEMLKGTLEGCVLEIVGSEETYGYAITRRLNELGFADVVVIGHWREAQATPRPFADRAGMLFLGAIHQQDSPNCDALAWFVR